MLVVISYPGNRTKFSGQKELGTLEESSRLQATRTTENVRKSIGRIYTILRMAFHNKSKACKLFHSYCHILVTEVSIKPLFWNPLSCKSPNWITRVNGIFLKRVSQGPLLPGKGNTNISRVGNHADTGKVSTLMKAQSRQRTLDRGNEKHYILTLLAVHICMMKTKMKVVTALQGSRINSQLVLLAHVAWSAIWLLIQELRRWKPKQKETKPQLRVKQFTTC